MFAKLLIIGCKVNEFKAVGVNLTVVSLLATVNHVMRFDIALRRRQICECLSRQYQKLSTDL